MHASARPRAYGSPHCVPSLLQQRPLRQRLRRRQDEASFHRHDGLQPAGQASRPLGAASTSQRSRALGVQCAVWPPGARQLLGGSPRTVSPCRSQHSSAVDTRDGGHEDHRQAPRGSGGWRGGSRRTRYGPAMAPRGRRWEGMSSALGEKTLPAPGSIAVQR
jgi:hypothetical protein